MSLKNPSNVLLLTLASNHRFIIYLYVFRSTHTVTIKLCVTVQSSRWLSEVYCNLQVLTHHFADRTINCESTYLKVALTQQTEWCRTTKITLVLCFLSIWPVITICFCKTVHLSNDEINSTNKVQVTPWKPTYSRVAFFLTTLVGTL